ncbi:hypothetical protein GS937_26155 [Rhodococcus hoagii]|nr:hypothetical protein [Prescottella equi]
MQTFGLPAGTPPRSCSPVDVRPEGGIDTNPASSWRAVGCSTPHWTPSPTVIGWSSWVRTATTCRPRRADAGVTRRRRPGRRAAAGLARSIEHPAT